MQARKKDLTNCERSADRLHSAAIHLLRRVRKEDAIMAEAPARLSALSVLVFGGSMTLGELATAEQVKPPTMSRIAVGLERGGLVRRISDAADARRVHLQATPKGAKLIHQGRRRRIKYLASHLHKLSRAEVAVLDQTLEILERILRNWK
jgi:DNA-binding MarR family transcriptional regulator